MRARLDSTNDRARMRVARIDAMNGEVTDRPSTSTTCAPEARGVQARA
jgi:hypothetical protein